jgi:excisionase family DNA binding protein
MGKRTKGKGRLEAIRARRAMGSPEDLARALGISRGVAYDLVRTGAVPASRAGRRYLIAWATITAMSAGEITFSMPRAA